MVCKMSPVGEILAFFRLWRSFRARHETVSIELQPALIFFLISVGRIFSGFGRKEVFRIHYSSIIFQCFGGEKVKSVVGSPGKFR